ncbi:MAG: 4Fe-4S binding protein, partial [candidate division WOR-3 bacterium]
IIPGGQKPFIHSLFPRIRDFSRVLIEIYNIRPPDIIIVDLLHVADARGKIRSPGMLVAGTNGHAVDYVCALLAGIHPLAVSTIRAAVDEGMLQPDTVDIDGPFKPLSGFTMPVWFPFRTTIVEHVGRLLYRLWLRRKPVVDKTRCTHCLACDHVCPSNAIHNGDINYPACIKCYCCLEVCPTQAITARL